MSLKWRIHNGRYRLSNKNGQPANRIFTAGCRTGVRPVAVEEVLGKRLRSLAVRDALRRLLGERRHNDRLDVPQLNSVPPALLRRPVPVDEVLAEGLERRARRDDLVAHRGVRRAQLLVRRALTAFVGNNFIEYKFIIQKKIETTRETQTQVDFVKSFPANV